MKRIKFLSKTTCVASLAALAFTFIGCSSDDSGEITAACSRVDSFIGSINGETSGEVCIEISGVSNEDKKEIKEECEDERKGEYYDSCPKGYAATCSQTYHGHKTTHYIYGDSFKGLDCTEYWAKH